VHHHNNLEVASIDVKMRGDENHIRWLGDVQWRLINAPLRIVVEGETSTSG